jgi:hypothetical protein
LAIFQVREEIDKFHQDWFTEATEVAREVGTEPSAPRLTGRQSHRNNVPQSNPEEYFRRAVAIPFLDHLIAEMSTR